MSDLIQYQADLSIGNITDNYEIVKKDLEELLAQYKDFVVSDSNLKEAKDIRANLNKTKKVIDDKRKEYKKLWNEPFAVYEEKSKNLIKTIDEVSEKIDNSIKQLEEQENERKKQEIESYFNSVNKFPDIIAFHKIFNASWLNKTSKIENIQQEINIFISKIDNDLKAMENIKSDANYPLLLDKYKENYDLSQVLLYKSQLEEQERRKTEFAKQQRELQEQNLQPTIEKKEVVERKTKIIKLTITRRGLELFNKLVEENEGDISFEVVE